MNPDQVEILLRLSGALGLLILNALLAAGEFSIIKLRLSLFNLEFLEEVKRLNLPPTFLEEADRTILSARFGILVCAAGYALLSFPLLFTFLTDVGLPEAWTTRALAFLLLIAVYFLLGELLPRGLAMTSPIKALQAASIAVRLSSLAGFLMARPLNRFSNFIFKHFGVEPGSEWEALGIEEQFDAMKDNPKVSQVLFKVIKNALQMRDVIAQDILLPRNQVKYFDINEKNSVNLTLAEQTEHTRFPLCDGDLDNCLGLIHIKDIFHSKDNPDSLDLRSIKREMVRVGENDSLEKVLRKLLLRKTHMALVTDEFGGANGVVTLEVILEQLVGEIQDEFDAEEELIKLLGPNEYAVSGLASIRDLEETLEVSIENKIEVTSFGGLITAELGRIPENGESLELEQMEVKITEVDETRVIAARVKVRRPFEGDESDQEP